MDGGTLQGLITLLAILAFLGMVAYVYSPRRRARYEEIAKRPLEEEDKP